MDEDAKAYFYKAIRETNYIWIVISLILSFFAFIVRAYRWKYVLEPLGFKTKFWNRYHALMIGYVVNLTIPRAGEASRSAMLYRSDGVPFSKSFGTIVAERAVDLCMLASISLLTAYFNYNDFKTIFTEIQSTFSGSESDADFPWKIVVYSALGIGLLVLILLMIFNKNLKTKLINIVKDVFQGIFSIFKCKNPLAYIGFTLLIWILYVSYFGIAFQSIEDTKEFPLSGIMLAFIAGSVGITFTNGGIGAFPILIGLVVNFVMSDSNPNAHAVGNALGMIIWSSQTILVIILGLISLLLLPKNFEKEHVEQIRNSEK